jgi:hypothetical protein
LLGLLLAAEMLLHVVEMAAHGASSFIRVALTDGLEYLFVVQQSCRLVLIQPSALT